LTLYPGTCLDYVGRTGPFVVADRVLELQPIGSLHAMDQSGNEWQRNRFFRGLALQWIVEQPIAFIQGFAWKTWVFFFELRNTPVMIGEQRTAGPLKRLGIAWMLVMRVLVLATIVMLLYQAVVRRRRRDVRLLGFYAAFSACYSAPFLIGFAYERHVIPFLAVTTVFLIIACAGWREPLRAGASRR